MLAEKQRDLDIEKLEIPKNPRKKTPPMSPPGTHKSWIFWNLMIPIKQSNYISS